MFKPHDFGYENYCLSKSKSDMIYIIVKHEITLFCWSVIEHAKKSVILCAFYYKN